jgi:DNA-binding MarR family transcriptional regulator
MASRNAAARPTAPTVEPAGLLDWVERVAMFFSDQYGLPPITGRIFGWLMICDPPAQSGASIAEAIGASRASITTNIRLLTAAGLVRRITRPRDRTAYYLIDDDAWERVIRRRMEGMASFREIAQDAIELLGGDGDRARRVRVARAVFQWFVEVLAAAAPVPQAGDDRG